MTTSLSRPRRCGSYREAIRWIAINDDTDWLRAGDGEAYCESVTLCLVADVFGRSLEEATADLRRELNRERGAA